MQARPSGCKLLRCSLPRWSSVMSRYSERDYRRRRLAQNFLRDRHLVNALASRVGSGELVLEVGAGAGALTLPLARSGAHVVAIERDPLWAQSLKRRLARLGLLERVDVKVGDFREIPLPPPPFRVICSPPFNLTTTLMHTLLDDPCRGPSRTDMIVQWEVALKRSAEPPQTLLSTVWAPWWHFEIVRRVGRDAFRPRPQVDAAWLVITKRIDPILPPSLAPDFAKFVRSKWPSVIQGR